MAALSSPITASKLGEAIGARVVGCHDRVIRSVESIRYAGEGSVTFLAEGKLGPLLKQKSNLTVVTTEDFVVAELPLTYLVVKNPASALSGYLSQAIPLSRPTGISRLASIHPTARLGEGVVVGDFVYIGPEAQLQAGVTIHPFCYVGANVHVGQGAELFPRVTVMDRVQIGARVKLYPHVVIGSDGFGYQWAKEGYQAVAQVGSVRIEDDVHIGAGSTVDRATLGETVVGKGTKLDNLVHVGHNCEIGANSILCAQVGLAGSSTIEDDVQLGGQVGVGVGVTVGSGARVGGQTGVTANLPRGNERYFFTPATPFRPLAKMLKYFRKLPEIWERLEALEKKIEARS